MTANSTLNSTLPVQNKTKWGKLIFILPLALTATACMENTRPYAYNESSVGRVQQVERGYIESYRWVEIAGRNQGSGTSAGAAIGAAAGSTVSKKKAEGIIGAIGGAIIGGIIGNSIEKNATKRSGFEYMVRTESGELVSIVQRDDVPLEKGLPVIIIYGPRARIVPDENAVEVDHSEMN